MPQQEQHTPQTAQTPDRIEREVSIAAPVERVWAVLTEPEHVGQWFGQGPPADIDLRPGGVMVLDHGQYGVFPTRIEKLDPPHHLSYLWASGYPGEAATEDNATLVEFTLTAEGTGTRLKVVETGFSRIPLPPERRDTASHASHSAGWTEVVQNIRRHVEENGV